VSCISALWTRRPWCAHPHSHADGVRVTKCMVKRVIHNGGRSEKGGIAPRCQSDVVTGMLQARKP